MLLTELKEKYIKVSYLERARSGWEEEYEVSSKQVNTWWLYFLLKRQLSSYCHGS